MRFLNPGSFGIVILCFLLPFINIKCNGVKLVTLSGVQMATGANINAGDQGMFGKRMMDETSTADKTKMMSIPLLVTLIVLVAAIATVLTMTLKNKDQRKIRRTAIVFHGVVIFGLIAEMGRMEYSIIHANNQASFGPISLSWGLDVGFWLALLIPIGIIIYNIIELRKPAVVIPLGDNNPPAPPQPNDGAPTLPQP